MKKFERTSGQEAMLLGVCGGLGKYFSIDPTIIRLITALVTIFSFGGLVIVYFIMAIVVPKENNFQ